MVTRKLVCEGEHASEKFDACWKALCVGRVMLLRNSARDNNGLVKQASAERRADRVLAAKFKAASEPAPKDMPRLDLTGEEQRIVTLGSTVVLTQPELERLLACIDAVVWPTTELDASCDAEDWLNSSEKMEA